MKLATFRPRFSLKWLLIAVTVLSVALFVLVIYPTNKAKRFVAGINDGRIDPTKELEWPFRSESTLAPISRIPLTAELKPYIWADFVSCQRRVDVSGMVPAAISTDGAFRTRMVVAVNPLRKWIVDIDIAFLPSLHDNRD